jgi:hypothetical protein
MKIDTKYSLKPFGTGTSCLDTIDGECKRGLTVEECMSICEESDMCGCGIHVDIKGRNPSIPSYCLPLNTIQYKNRPLATSLISTENNGTILSKENNVDITFFREEEQFPSIEETFQQLKSDLIFNNDIVLISFERKNKKGEKLQLQVIPPSYNIFSEYIFTNSYIILRTIDFSVSDTIRVHNKEIVYFFYENTSLVLTYDFEKKNFTWENYTDNLTTQKNVFLLETHKDTEFVDYIDSITPLYIIMEYKNKKYYMDMNEENGLILREKKPENRLYLLNRDLEKDDTVQQIDTKKLFDDRVDYMNKTMQTYLQKYFPDKSGEGTRIVTLSSCKDKFVRILGIIILILSILLIITYFSK